MTRREFVAAAGGTIVNIGLPGVFIKMMDTEHQIFSNGRTRLLRAQRLEQYGRSLAGRESYQRK